MCAPHGDSRTQDSGILVFLLNEPSKVVLPTATHQACENTGCSRRVLCSCVLCTCSCAGRIRREKKLPTQCNLPTSKQQCHFCLPVCEEATLLTALLAANQILPCCWPCNFNMLSFNCVTCSCFLFLIYMLMLSGFCLLTLPAGQNHSSFFL